MINPDVMIINIIISDAWKSRWVESKHKSDYGEWKLTAGKFYGDAEADKGNLHVAFTLSVCVCIVAHRSSRKPTR